MTKETEEQKSLAVAARAQGRVLPFSLTLRKVPPQPIGDSDWEL